MATYNVKVLVAGSNNLGNAEKGDVIEVVPSVSDWGSATVTPDWLRLTITNVPGVTQQLAEDKVRAYLQAWEGEFIYSIVLGAPDGQWRYRIEASAEIANDFDLNTKLEIRDRILARFNGTPVDQSSSHMEFDAYPGIPMDEIAFEINQISYRRFRFSEKLVNQALDSVNPGEPAEFSRNMNYVQSNIVDKLKN
jgi:hypothetical protein